MIPNGISERVFNLGLKGSSLLSKLLFVIALTKLLSENEFAYYSLFISIAMYIVSVVGLEYHAFSNRALIFSKDSDMIFTNHIAYALIACLFGTAVVYFVFVTNILPISFFYFMLLFVVLEYLSLEIIRYLNIINKQLLSSVVVSIKTTLFMLPTSCIIYFEYYKFDIYEVIRIWNLFIFLSCVFGGIIIAKLNTHKVKVNRLSASWVMLGIKKSRYIFISAQLSLLLFIIDRLAIESFGSLNDVAVYGFFFTISFSLLSAVEASVFAFYIPAVIRVRTNKIELFIEYKKAIKLVIIFLLICIPIMLVIISPLLEFIDKNIYIEKVYVYYALLLFISLRIFSYIPHYVIYALGLDDVNMGVTIKSLLLFIFIACVAYMISFVMIDAVLLALVFTSAYQLLAKSFFVNDLKMVE